jgi:hypothetical protein
MRDDNWEAQTGFPLIGVHAERQPSAMVLALASERDKRVEELNSAEMADYLRGFDDATEVAIGASSQSPAANGDEDWNIRKYIDFLRADEGDSVTILCDNPDFNGQPNCAIECNGYWTNWQDRRFGGDTIEVALELAYFECRHWRENPPAEVSPDPVSRSQPENTNKE